VTGDNDRVELVVDAHAMLGESPVWDEQARCLYWVDLLAGIVHRTDPSTGADRTVALGGTIGAVALRQAGGLVAAVDDGIGFVDPSTGAIELTVPISAADPTLRMNDGKVDPGGRFWAGTMAYDERAGAGTLYRIDPDLTATPMVADVTISNGLDWTADGRTFYYIDTVTRRVDRFDFDLTSGTISDRRPAVEIRPGNGYPDGMTLDADDHLWVALFDGWAVHRYSPDGVLERRIELPAAQVTSVAFGGDDLEELYITTAQEGFPPGGKPDQPHAGGLFRCRPGVRGCASNRFGG
jgi:sugar lactone lactonase YvrE